MIRDDHSQMMSDDELIRLSNELRDLLPTPEDIKAMNESFRIAEELRSAPENLQ